jgi:hypothetical protein
MDLPYSSRNSRAEIMGGTKAAAQHSQSAGMTAIVGNQPAKTGQMMSKRNDHRQARQLGGGQVQ